MKYFLFYICLIAHFSSRAQIDLVVVGQWEHTISALDILEAGSDFSNTHESLSGQVTLSVLGGLGSFNWQIDVQKGNEDWHPNLQLNLKRTGNGVGLGTIAGGTAYQTIANTAQPFILGSDNRTTVPLQYEVQGVSVTIPAKTYYTTVIFTVTEL
ncbi:MAG: hypothetical protein AAGJ18_18485 [Bacteroidota bacterium]